MSGLRIHSDLVRQGLENVLIYEGFKFGGSKANTAIESAKCVLHWASMPENGECFIAFSDELNKASFSNRTFFYAILMGYPFLKKTKHRKFLKSFSPWLACRS